MSSDLEEVFNCINNAQVPPLWEKVSSPIHCIDVQYILHGHLLQL